MYEFYNPHPHEKNVGDCVKRAFTKASGKTYQEVSIELNRLKREMNADAFNSNEVWTKYVTEVLGGVYKSYPATKGELRMNGERFCNTYPHGTYVLRMAGHLTCCVDGVIYDSWDCSEKCVYSAYKIPPKDTPPDKEDSSEESKDTQIEKIELNGEDIIRAMAEALEIKKLRRTRKNELWISLKDHYEYLVVLNLLRDGLEYKSLTHETKRKSTYIFSNKDTGLELVLKNCKTCSGLWCVNPGTR